MHFYEVDGVLVRRWVPAQRRIGLEFWNGDGWARYADVDNVLRYGQPVTEARAMALLHETRDKVGIADHLSDEEARIALRDRLRRG